MIYNTKPAVKITLDTSSILLERGLQDIFFLCASVSGGDHGYDDGYGGYGYDDSYGGYGYDDGYGGYGGLTPDGLGGNTGGGQPQKHLCNQQV